PPAAGKDWLPGLIEVVQLTGLLTDVLIVIGPLLEGAAETVLLITVPLGRPELTCAIRVMVSVVPGAIEEKVTVRLLPAPPQTPVPVALHDTKLVVPGRLSVTR